MAQAKNMSFGEAVTKIEDLVTRLEAAVAKAATLGVDVENNPTLVDANNNLVVLDNSPAPAGTTGVGSTIGGVLAALVNAMFTIQDSSPNRVIVTLNSTTGVASFDLPQDIAKTSSPEFDTVLYKKLKGNSGAPTITLGPGAGTGASVTLITGNDDCFKIQITTGTGCATAATIFEAAYASGFQLPPFVMIHPYNRKAWDQQNTANKAVAVNDDPTTGSTKNKMVIQSAGTTALTDSTSYIWIIETKVRAQ